MMMTMSEIASDLARVHRELGQLGADLYRIERDIKAHEVDAMSGVNYKSLGSNETERKLALDTLLAGDVGLRTLQARRDTLKEREIILQAKIEELVALRRALEWDIRARLVDMRVTHGVQENHRGSANGDTIFDDAMDHALTADIEALYGPRLPF